MTFRPRNKNGPHHCQRGKPGSFHTALHWFAEACYESGTLQSRKRHVVIGRAKKAHALAWQAAQALFEQAGVEHSDDDIDAACAFCAKTVESL